MRVLALLSLGLATGILSAETGPYVDWYWRTNDFSVNEGDGALTTEFVVTVYQCSGGSFSGSADFDLYTEDGEGEDPAVAPGDYSSVSDTVTVGSGGWGFIGGDIWEYSTSGPSISIVDDELPEPEEIFGTAAFVETGTYSLTCDGFPVHRGDWDTPGELVGVTSFVYIADNECDEVEITGTSGNVTADYNTTTKLTLTISGSSPFTYAWYEGPLNDTSNHVGSSSSYTTPKLTSGPKSYWVSVSNCESGEEYAVFTVSVDDCEPPEIVEQPASVRIEPDKTARLTVDAEGSVDLKYQWYEGVSGDTAKKVGTNSRSFTTPKLATSASYWVRVTNDCGERDSVTATVAVGSECIPATILQQSQSVTAVVDGTVDLSVVAGGDEPRTYQWYEGLQNDETKPVAGATAPTFTAGPFATHGTFSYWVKVTNACGSAGSVTIVVTVPCADPALPRIFSPSSSPSTSAYDVSWSGNLARATSYELQEATNSGFTQNLKTFMITGALKATIEAHSEVTSDRRFFYRVRAFSLCTGLPGAYSRVTSTIVTAPIAPDEDDFAVVIPVESTKKFIQKFFIPGFGEIATDGDSFAVSADVPWLTPVPASGALPASGKTIDLFVDPEGLAAGTAKATITLVRTQGSAAKVRTDDGGTVNIPFSMNLVTPVTPEPRPPDAPSGTLIIPAVFHGTGVGAEFRSDVRIVNVSSDAISYDLTYTPAASDGTQSGKKTTITIAGNDSMALDDIVKNWYGAGLLDEFGLGTLEIRPQGDVDPFATFAASRTYALTPGGTLGQFVPALRLDDFITKDSESRISLQQVANSAAFRTNFGFVEGSGVAAEFRVRLLDSNNQLLQQITRTLPPYGIEQVPFTAASLFGNAGIENARVEVEVVSAGKVTAYASVLDNKTTDPLMVFPEQPATIAAQSYTVPGVAEFDFGASNFHTDMQIFNASDAAVTLTLDFYPTIGNLDRPAAVEIALNAFEVRAIDAVLPTLWGRAGSGGSVVVRGPSAVPLVVTARTFSRDAEGGTYGQFVAGLTSADAKGMGERATHVLQLEESLDPADGDYGFRANVGLVEVMGNEAVVEVTGYDPAAKVTSVIQTTLAPHQYIQYNGILRSMFGRNVYNGRVSARVIAGSGRVATYGSVVDNATEDPTYIPGQ